MAAKNNESRLTSLTIACSEYALTFAFDFLNGTNVHCFGGNTLAWQSKIVAKIMYRLICISLCSNHKTIFKQMRTYFSFNEFRFCFEQHKSFYKQIT